MVLKDLFGNADLNLDGRQIHNRICRGCLRGKAALLYPSGRNDTRHGRGNGAVADILFQVIHLHLNGGKLCIRGFIRIFNLIKFIFGDNLLIIQEFIAVVCTFALSRPSFAAL